MLKESEYRARSLNGTDLRVCKGVKSMRNQTRLLLVIALGFAFASGQSLASLPSEGNSNPEANRTVTVLVAMDDLSAGTPITTPELCFEQKQVPLTSASKRALHGLVDMKGQKLEKSLAKGDFATLDAITPPLARTWDGALLPDMLACSVLVECDSICGGFWRRYNKVDLILTVKNETQESDSRVIMRHLLVLAADQAQSKPGGEAKLCTTLTLAVCRGQDEQLKAAAFQGKITAHLSRPTEHADEEPMRLITVQELLAGQE
jgi:Flp pilus assembly protein CpaB